MANPINRALMSHRPLVLSGLLLDGQYRLPPATARRRAQPASGLAAIQAVAKAARRPDRGNAR